MEVGDVFDKGFADVEADFVGDIAWVFVCIVPRVPGVFRFSVASSPSVDEDAVVSDGFLWVVHAVLDEVVIGEHVVDAVVVDVVMDAVVEFEDFKVVLFEQCVHVIWKGVKGVWTGEVGFGEVVVGLYRTISDDFLHGVVVVVEVVDFHVGGVIEVCEDGRGEVDWGEDFDVPVSNDVQCFGVEEVDDVAEFFGCDVFGAWVCVD